MSLLKGRARCGDQGLSSRSEYMTSGGRISAALFRTPKDQETLLEKNDAWAGVLSTRPQGPVNIPPSVMEGLVAFHAKQAQATKRLSPAPAASSSPQAAAARLPSRSSSRSENEEESRPATPSPRGPVLHQSPPETAISWPSSPVDSRPAAFVRLENTDGISSPIRRPCLNLATQPPASPGMSRNYADRTRSPFSRHGGTAGATLRSCEAGSISSPISAAPKRKLYSTVPSSSVCNSEDELPLVVPTAYECADRVTRNHLARSGPTPPSAQVIPYSEAQASEETPRRKRQRMQPLNEMIWADPDGQASPSVPQETPVPQNPLSSPQSGPRHRTLPISNNRNAPPTPANRRPFDQFKATYPDYRGDLRTFIRACICLEYLEKQAELIPFLYDDFIRAFTHGYVPYVEERTECNQTLTAIKWYNKNTTQPIYNKLVMSFAAVARVFEVYPEEVEDLRAGLAGTETQMVQATGESQSLIQASTEQQTEETENEQLKDGSWDRGTGSPDLSASKSAHSRLHIPEARERPKSRIGSWFPPHDFSSQPPVIIPNTSRSVLEANPTRIPETVRKPKPPRLLKSPHDADTGSTPSNTTGSKARKGRQSIPNREKLRQSLREHMMKTPHPRLAASNQK